MAFKHLLRKIYDVIPFKRHFFLILRQIWRPPAKVYRHLHFKGPFRVHCEGRKFWLQHYGFEFENSIFWSGLSGDWEGQSMKLWIELCKNSKVIYDIGANTGVFSLVAKTLQPTAQVHAFEPIERVYRKLVANTLLNRFDIRCIPKAASNLNGQAIVYDQPTDHIYSVTINKNLAPLGTSVFKSRVETLRLDSYWESLGSEGGLPDLLKIDVETHEPEVLEGLGKLIELARPDLLIEILNEDVSQKVQKLLSGLGYCYFNINEKGRPRRQAHLSASDSWNFLVCKEETAQKLRI